MNQERHKCVLEYLRNNPKTYAHIKNIKRKCGKDTKDILKELEKSGTVISKGKKYALIERTNYIKGIFDGKRDGYGFLMPDTDMRDLFIAPGDTYTALNGDLVLAEKKKKSRGRWTGRIVEIIEREKEYFVGRMERYDDELMFKPQDRNIPYHFEIKNPESLNDGDWVLVRLIKWTTPVLYPLAEFVEKVTRDNLRDILVKQEYNLKHGFPDIVTSSIPEESHLDMDKREDFTQITTITIDPEDAKDIDDAVSIEKKGGKYLLWVHIADVASFVKKDSPIDEEARDRGCTTYLPDDTFFMLPKKLTDMISLNEGQVSPSVTVQMEFKENGDMTQRKFYRSKIISDKKFSYTETQNIIDGKKNSPFKKDLHLMSELAEILSDRREREGYLDFYRQEVEIDIEDSEIIDIKLREDLWTNEIIEQFMIAANEAVAARLYSNKTPAIFRIHEEPDDEQLQQYREVVNNLGFELHSIDRKSLADFLKSIKKSPYERVLNYELLRCMKRARYIAQAEPHYGLASEFYTHFTSPIRRYPDLVVQRILFGENYSEEELKEIADHSTEQEWKADEAEREITKFYIMSYLEKNRDREFRGMIVNVIPDGVWVELDEFLISGFLPIKLMPPDNYRYTEYSLEGGSHSFRNGDLLLCSIYSVSPEINELILDFSGKISKQK